jgi:hypothetical protein
VTSWSRSAPRAGNTCPFSCRKYVSTVTGDRCPSLANRSSPLQPHRRRSRESIRAPEAPAPRRARSTKADSRAVRAAHSVRASRSTIRRTPSKSRNHARARYGDPPGDLDTDTSPTPQDSAGAGWLKAEFGLYADHEIEPIASLAR